MKDIELKACNGSVIGGCSGHYACTNPVRWVRRIYYREFFLCQKHKHEEGLGGSNWIKEAKADWKQMKRDEAKGNVRYPRTFSNRVTLSSNIIDEIVHHYKSISEKEFKRKYMEWIGVMGRIEGKRSFDRFVKMVGNYLK